jgi:Xaa-Pro aminopeptidase
MTELDEKTERLAKLSREADLGGIVVVSQPGFAWLTGGGSNRIDGSRENGSGALFVRADGRRYVIANAIEMPRLVGEELAGGGWEAVEYPWTEEQARPMVIHELASALVVNTSSRIGADWPIAACVPLDSACARLRAPLTGAELTRYRALGADAGRALGDVARQLTPGLTEHEVARRIYDAARALGGRATVVLVAADERMKRFRHPVPTAAAWKRILMLVACIQRGGLVVALSRIVSTGPPDADVARRTDATAQVFGQLLQATRAGARGRELFAAAKRGYTDAGFEGEELRHHQGGAIGYRSREWVAHPESDEVVHPRQALAWNPSIAGTKVEDTALLAEGGIELLTTTPGWPTIAHGAAGILSV